MIEDANDYLNEPGSAQNKKANEQTRPESNWQVKHVVVASH